MTTITATPKEIYLAKGATLGWYSDPGHAWLAVNISSIDGYRNAKNFASQYSYVDSENYVVYLEEDCDAQEYLKYHGLDARTLPIYSVDEESEIRNLPRGNAS